MSESSTCRNCGRTSDEWVQFSHELGADVCWNCHQELIADANAEAQTADGASGHEDPQPPEQEPEQIRIVTVEEFGGVDEPGAEPVLGEPGEAVFPEGGDVMIYGDGGASKTTLGIDGGYHLAAGDDWLGIPVPKPVNVLVIEAEGPRPLFRAKIRAKNDSRKGSDRGDRVRVMETPWASFRFPDAEEIADLAGDLEIDVLIVGPLTRVGMEELGTLQQVRDFMAEVGKFRERSGRRLLVILIHHENKGGKVSGAWEGAGDTLLHAEVHARGRTTLTVQKARWSSEWHKRSLELAWTDGEGFEPIEEEERDLMREIVELLRENPHRTAKEISAPPKAGGIGANVDTVKGILEHNQDRFLSRTKEAAKAVGRSPLATVWALTQAPSQSESHDSVGGGGDLSDSTDSPVRESVDHESPPLDRQSLTQASDHPESPEVSEGASDDEARREAWKSRHRE